MKEDFLHYIWKHKKFKEGILTGSQEEQIEIKSTGLHNALAGPDFFNGSVIINDQLWAGNIEIHIKSSDWYAHNHESDAAYDNVILHVVWEHDMDVFRQDNSIIPTLVLAPLVPKNTLENYRKLFSLESRWINCEKDINSIDSFLMQGWLERIYVERLEQKAIEIDVLLKASANDWEAVLFKMLAKNFGLNINGEALLSMANSFEYGTLRKLQGNAVQLEALFFGQAWLLEEVVQEAYQEDLYKEYQFLVSKYQLNRLSVLPCNFFKLRPNNFPTIRLSQLAALYLKETNLFSKIIIATDKKEYYELFNVKASSFWDTHFTFQTTSAFKKKKLTKAFIDLLLINTIIPLKFSYAKATGIDITNSLIDLVNSISAEKNSIIEKYKTIGVPTSTAMHSQALLQLKKHYCDPNKCMRCAIGNQLIVNNF
jgi:hypothetical protein